MAFEPIEDVKMDMSALVVAIATRWLKIALVTALLVVGAFVILKFVPKQYESSASILVESRENAFTRATNDVLARSGAADPSAISSQIELIKSRDTLLQVIETEGLRDIAEFNGRSRSPLNLILPFIGRPTIRAVSDEYVLNAVASNLKVIRQRDSSIISILFRSRDSKLAANVANAIANTHVKRRGELSVADTVEATQWLLVEIEKMRTRVAAAETKVATYRVENDLFVGTNNTSLLDQQLSAISGQITSSQERKNTAKSRAALIRGLLKAGQPIDGVPDVRESVVVQRLSEDKARLKGERAQQLATLLPNHPDIQALSAQIAEINKQILIEGRQVADALDAEASIEAGIEAALRDELVRLKIDASGATKSNVTLNELEREATAQRDLLETYLLRYRDAAARTDSLAALPNVRVVAAAAASLSPASPKTSFILAAVGVGALTLQVGAILFGELVSGRALIEVSRGDTSRRRQDNIGLNAEGISGLRTTQYDNDDMPEDERSSRSDEGDGNYGIEATGEHIAVNDERLVLVVTMGSWQETQAAIEAITSDLIGRGRSVAEIDAGSRRVTSELGLSDLCNGIAEFGDVVHRGKRSDFAMVPWGQSASFDPNSKRSKTLIEALGEIFETVFVDVGRVGVISPLPHYANLGAMVLLAVEGDEDSGQIEDLISDISTLGFSNFRVVTLQSDQSKVA